MGDGNCGREGCVNLSGKAPTLEVARAGRWLKGAERAMEDRRWDDVVYSSQMVVEHSVKAVLMGLGIHFTKQHDVSDLLLGVAGRVEVPDWFRQNIGKVSDALAKLSEQRALASYGFEEGIGVGYFEDFAPQALADAQYVYARCRDALDEILQNRSPEG